MASLHASRTDTIFALTSPPAKSGVAIIRLSGPLALQSLKQLCRMETIHPRHAHYASFFDTATGELIDSGIAIFFVGPHSFTGEDVVELQVHGSLAVIRQLSATLGVMTGLRMAEPGEFTRRAFLNGKMDLLEAEGLADLIDAETSQQKSQAMRQMHGELSGFFDTLRTDIIRSLAHLEAYIDFPDEDIPESVLSALANDLQGCEAQISDALQDRRRGERLRDGMTIAILGAPNAGKSSLLNRIAKRDAAIVSQHAGTTRDAIEVHMDIAGYPVVLVDTAGLRDSEDEIEREGIRRALQRAEQADIKLILLDGSHWPKIDTTSMALADAQSLIAVNKSDLIENTDTKTDIDHHSPVFISTQTGQGLEALLDQLQSRIVDFFSGGQGCYITRERHRQQLQYAIEALRRAQEPLPLELKCEELRQAAQAVGKITGKIQVDDILDVIFKSFCIGK